MRRYRIYSSNTSTSTGIGTLGVLQIIFIVLKLTGLIDWSWPIVLIPLWIDIGIFWIALFIFIFIYICDYKHK